MNPYGARATDESFNQISPILSYFGADFVPHRKRKHVARKIFILPTDFSLTTNAERVISFVFAIVKYARIAKFPRIVLDYRKVKNLGLGAEAFLATILKEIQIENSGVSRGSIRGYEPEDPTIRNLMNDGCARVLRAGADEDINLSLSSNSEVYRHVNRGNLKKSDGLSADKIALITTEFSDHLDKSLNLRGRMLSPSGRDNILNYVAEVLINADEHSVSSTWVVVGYIDKKQLVYRSAIFSIGNTIAKNFHVARDGKYHVWDLVDPYIQMHSQSGLFKPNWRPDDLLCVISLQGNISTRRNAPSDSGQGTVDLIRFFQGVHNECGSAEDIPMMNLISGQTQIKFDGRYQMEIDAHSRRDKIAFNSANDLNSPPDSDAVIALTGSGFPGVLISVQVPLAKSVMPVNEDSKQP